MAWDPIKGSHRSKGDKLKDALQGFTGGFTQGKMMQMMMGDEASKEEEACELRRLNGEAVMWDSKTKQCVPFNQAVGATAGSDASRRGVGSTITNAIKGLFQGGGGGGVQRRGSGRGGGAVG